MTLLRSIWVICVTIFDLNFGSGDKWWAWAVVYASFIAVAAMVQDPMTDLFGLFILALLPIMGMSALGIVARKRWRSPTQVHLTHG